MDLSLCFKITNKHAPMRRIFDTNNDFLLPACTFPNTNIFIITRNPAINAPKNAEIAITTGSKIGLKILDLK
jgi:hypothetical protein